MNFICFPYVQLSHSAPVRKIEKIKQQWTLGDVVDRQTLRTEVQEFCGNFPIYRLEPYTPDSVTVVAGTRAGKCTSLAPLRYLNIHPSVKDFEHLNIQFPVSSTQGFRIELNLFLVTMPFISEVVINNC